ncbi:biopolymer transporter ExbD [Marinobacter sp. CHS3-4]|uniref:ExbD/TolR family protein n=1 Tax=Marinobacter sp. CHS3-4 TaxID=3045174 RepID=UPI0024B598E2|nr:biopolymer transporter ExbD [Marinobacter sp. CHS3-4]MDI9243640.1 biopolymer transporter ExbD [Marinobacter sp. CHS3-4]
MPFVEPRPAKPLAIRITPLIDVVFILLVFFMLTTRLLPVGLMEVSTSVRSSASSADTDPVPEISILPNQELAWNDQHYSLDDLVSALKTAGISRVRMVSTPDATVQDFTLALSTLDYRGIKPNWVREQGAKTQP